MNWWNGANFNDTDPNYGVFAVVNTTTTEPNNPWSVTTDASFNSFKSALVSGTQYQFVPRVTDTHPDAIPCPYPHASVDCDEVEARSDPAERTMLSRSWPLSRNRREASGFRQIAALPEGWRSRPVSRVTAAVDMANRWLRLGFSSFVRPPRKSRNPTPRPSWG